MLYNALNEKELFLKIEHNHDKIRSWMFILSVNAKDYSFIMSTKKLSIGSCRSRVFDDYNLNICFKCSKFSNIHKTTATRCGICAGVDPAKEFNNKEGIKYCHCLLFISVYNTNRKVYSKNNDKNKCLKGIDYLYNQKTKLH